MLVSSELFGSLLAEDMTRRREMGLAGGGGEIIVSLARGLLRSALTTTYSLKEKMIKREALKKG